MSTAGRFVGCLVFCALVGEPGAANATKCGVINMGAGRAFDDDFLNEVRKQYHWNVVQFINELSHAVPHKHWSREAMACRIAVTMLRDEGDSWRVRAQLMADAAAREASRPYATRMPLLALHRWTQEVSNSFCAGHEIEEDLEDPLACDGRHHRVIAGWDRERLRMRDDGSNLLNTEIRKYPYTEQSSTHMCWTMPFEEGQLQAQWHTVDALQRARQKYFKTIDTVLTGLAHAAGARRAQGPSASYNQFKYELIKAFPRPTMEWHWRRLQDADWGDDKLIFGLNCVRGEWWWELQMSYHPNRMRPIPERWTPEASRAISEFSYHPAHEPAIGYQLKKELKRNWL